LLYIYSCGKNSLELCDVFRTHSSQKRRTHGFYSKRSLWQRHFLSFFLSSSLSLYSENFYLLTENGGPGSSVGIATELRAGRSGIESQWGRDFPPVQTGPGAHPASCKMGTGSFPAVKCGRSVLLTTHPLLVQRSCKSRAIHLPTLWVTPGL
jgi:hypothetical protein